MEITHNDYVFNDDKNLIQLENVCKLLEKSYWANNRKLEINKKAIENSICIGIYKDKKIVGLLATRDAHELYEKYGFYKVGEKYMRKDG